MFDQIFGNYLVEAGKITKDQLADVIAYESTVRVKLGLIAVAEKLLTMEQADEVNQLQAIMDKRFGDIAVEKGYLTSDQVENLLKKQGNIYMIFVQTLIDKQIMTLEEIDKALEEYQSKMGFAHSDMDALVSGDIDRTVKLFLPTEEELVEKHCAVAVRTFLRIIDSSAYVSKAYVTDSIKADNLAMQTLQGDHTITAAFVGRGDALLQTAGAFAKEEFDTVDMDALDSIGEFTNCINGLFAVEMGNEGTDLDMLPPEFFESATEITGKKLCVMPIHSKEKEILFVIAFHEDIIVK